MNRFYPQRVSSEHSIHDKSIRVYPGDKVELNLPNSAFILLMKVRAPSTEDAGEAVAINLEFFTIISVLIVFAGYIGSFIMSATLCGIMFIIILIH